MYICKCLWHVLVFYVHVHTHTRTRTCTRTRTHTHTHTHTHRTFIMFSVITNIYNKKTKGPTLMELFTAPGKLKKLLILTNWDVRCVHHGVTWHTSRWHSSSCHTRVKMGESIIFTAAMIHAFRSARSHGSGGTYTVRPIIVVHTSNVSSC
jgi:hypothetical protein